MSDDRQFLAITGTIGTGTVTSCKLTLNTDGTVSFDPTAVASCIAVDQTTGVVLPVTFSNAGAASGWAYGSVTMTSPGAVNIAGNSVTLWCIR